MNTHDRSDWKPHHDPILMFFSGVLVGVFFAQLIVAYL